jgi:hypothetical protein
MTYPSIYYPTAVPTNNNWGSNPPILPMPNKHLLPQGFNQTIAKAVAVPMSSSLVPSTQDSYTPAATQPTQQPIQPLPLMGGHPMQTTIATGLGAVGGGLIGGSIQQLGFNNIAEEELQPQPSNSSATTTTTRTIPEAINSGWEVEERHPDGITPTKIKDTTKNILYEINVVNDTVSCRDLNGPPAQPTLQETILSIKTDEIDALAQKVGDSVSEKKESQVNEKFSLTHTVTKNVANGNGQQNPVWQDITDVVQINPTILEVTTTRFQSSPRDEKTYRALVHQAEKVAVELNPKGEITALYHITNPSATKTNSVILSDEQIEKILTVFGDELPEEAKTSFRQKLNPGLNVSKWFGGKPNVSTSAFDALAPEHQVLLRGVATVFASPLEQQNGYATWDELKAACGFKPAETEIIPEILESTTEVITEAPKKLAKELDWGKLALPALAGAAIVGGAVFGVDYFLQRRQNNTPNPSTPPTEMP